MGVITNLITGTQGENISNGWFDTPYGGNTIAEPTLTKAQKTFSSQDITPNLPKPKTLYFVYFHLNPALESRIEYKNKFIETIIAANGNGLDTGGYKQETTYKNVSDKIQNSIKETLKGHFNTGYLNHILKESPTSDLADKIYGGFKENSSNAILDYIPTKDMFNKLSFEISKMVKSYDKPGISSLDATEFNEYNRKRYVYTGIKYKDVKISFYDVKESPVQQFFIAYLKFINGDSFCKDASTWEKPIDNCHWQNAKGYKTVDGQSINGTYYGNLNSFGLNIDSNFRLIDRISFCEYYMNKMTVYTIENPVVTSIDFGSGIMGDFQSNDITVTFKYEGITNDLIVDEIENIENYKGVTGGLAKWWDNLTHNKKMHSASNPLQLKCMVNHSIQSNIANFMQTRYSTISGKIVSDIASTLKAYKNGDVKFSWNTLKNQALDTMRKYNMAGAANTIAQAEQTIKNYNSKDGKGKMKYLVNMTTDPTSLIGKATISSGAGRG